ncbi:hypothetical protein HID58_069567 [Brassica napus]|uniref:DUF223 domain-containing protein n=1 Tax=Brassica napus TaxID=3708 RepID=A0ABQ7YWC6_BRANA|nr:hypothetical protein HID58_069567 [Brassica napus]
MFWVRLWIVVMSKIFSVPGESNKKKLEFTVSDINDSHLSCCIWGNLAEKLHSAINQEDGMVTMLLRINDDDKTLTSFQSNEDTQEDNDKQVDQSEKRGQSDKFWLHLMVSDDTCVSKIMILDKVANGIVAESPEKLLNGSWDEIVLSDLIGKNFTFGVYVEKENVAYGAEIYKIGKIYKERMTCVPDAITTCQSDKNLEITSGDEDSIYLSESQETADAVSTPSSKRKKDETIDQGDLSSTSKKPCTRSIKIEIVEEANKKR